MCDYIHSIQLNCQVLVFLGVFCFSLAEADLILVSHPPNILNAGRPFNGSQVGLPSHVLEFGRLSNTFHGEFTRLYFTSSDFENCFDHTRSFIRAPLTLDFIMDSRAMDLQHGLQGHSFLLSNRTVQYFPFPSRAPGLIFPVAASTGLLFHSQIL